MKARFYSFGFWLCVVLCCVNFLNYLVAMEAHDASAMKLNALSMGLLVIAAISYRFSEASSTKK